MNHRSVIALVTSGMLCAAAAPAQTTSARVSGSALDQVGGLLPYVKVLLTNRRSMAHHEVRTDQAGHFEIEGLAPGDYLLEAERSGFTTAHDSLTVGPGDHLHHEVTLIVAPFEEHFVVTSAVPDARPPSVTESGAQPDASESAVGAAKCETSAIGGELERPVRIRGMLPEYPRGLRDAGVKGAVVIGGRLVADGQLTGARVLRAAHADLAAASVAAIEQWRWTAPRLDCVPIEASLTITIEFRIGP